MSASGKRVHNENTLKQDSTPNVNKKRKLENSGNLKRKENPKKRKFGGLDERKSKRRKQCRIDTMFTPSSVNVSADESAEKISPVDKVTNDKATNVTDLNLQHKRKRVHNENTLKQDSTPNVNKKRKLENSGNLNARVRRQRFSPAFAVTYNKVQGMTLPDGVVLSLKRHTHARLGSISIEKFFVGISRAKSINRIAILPCDVETELHYLTQLEFSAEKRYWFQNYIESEDGGSSWNANSRFILPEIEKKINAVRKKGLGKASRNDLLAIAKQAGYEYGAGTSPGDLSAIYNEVLKRLEDGLLYDFSTKPP